MFNKGAKFKVKSQLTESAGTDGTFEVFIEDATEVAVKVLGNWIGKDEFSKKYQIIEVLNSGRTLLMD